MIAIKYVNSPLSFGLLEKNRFTSWQGLDESSLDDSGHERGEPWVGLEHLNNISGRDELQQDQSSLDTSSFEPTWSFATFLVC